MEDPKQTDSQPDSQPAQDPQGVVSRVGNLPLVSSAYEMLSSAYSSTMQSVPLLKGVMDVAESGARTLGAAASTGSKPILDRLEPQITAVNQYAMLGLDKVEQKLPILQQPADKLYSDTVGMMYQSVTGAKDAMIGAVMGGVEKTRAAVNESINSVSQMVSSGVNLALSHSESWVDHYLPLSEKELAELSEPVPSEEAAAMVSSSPAGSGSNSSPSASYFVRLGKLSSKVRERALEQSLSRARNARAATHTAVTQISSTLDLLENARTTLVTANQQLGGAPEQLMQRWKEWQQTQQQQQGQPQEGQGQGAQAEQSMEVDETKDHGEQLEGWTLSMARDLTGQLRVACATVVSSAQGLPSTVQEQLLSARRTAEELQRSLVNASTLTPHLLQQTRKQITQVRQSLDGVVEYLLHNTPLNWLVGPFSPQNTEKVEPGTQPAPPSQG
ncbi:mannose-6-phosphate receptor binding protein 1 [Clupea harengus]|uniref:Perilipin n=1 Tax=Clupea harengus TaxID=7950 RepID=A0A6P8G4G1_CLUHA|nr:mannose-6-phosphate receptor binding protein 1 [Clupea harengus]XP_031430447.1 mannose-6-phosphate receptor binding protein 1 [Clupea harengus]XP_031430448.1 mannose-6-phosphate receptor binding protein 1 [Clupea harengus]